MKVVVSGVGMVSPLGWGTQETWKRLLAGESGIVPKSHHLEAVVPAHENVSSHPRATEFALYAAREALLNAGLNPDHLESNLMGCSVSQSKPFVQSSAENPARLDPSLLMSSFFGCSVGDVVHQNFKLSGPCLNVVAACATGLASLEWGQYWIRSGQCDMVLVGAAESSLNKFYRAGFQQMGVLVQGTQLDLVCPFDARRSGFVMGEGAAVMLIESESSCRRRRHNPLAILESVMMAQSVNDSIRFDESGSAVANLVQRVTGDHRPDYVNAHGTGTRFNDATECHALNQVFGDLLKNIPVSSTKAATGHLLGAAGAIEACFTVLSLRDQKIPPTLNYTSNDPDCLIDCVPNKSRTNKLDYALTLSYGFGGQLGGAFFSRFKKE